MGADSFGEIDTWREPARVLESASWVVVTRPGHEIGTAHLPEGLRSRIIDLRGGEPPIEPPPAGSQPAFTYLLDCVSEDISSTQIRRMVCERHDTSGLMPQLVAGYIEKYELYRR
jgi:nicotinic acid mononucleotide adenylyltransferase